LPTSAEKLVLRYRWEFLRRNAEFRRDFDAYFTKYSEWYSAHGWWYDPEVRYSKDELRYLRETIHTSQGTIYLNKATFGMEHKWDVSEPVPYDWEFDGSGRYELRPGVFVEIPDRFMRRVAGDVGRLSESELRGESERRTSVADADVVGADYWDQDIYLRVRITFSVETLMAKIEAEIRKARREYKQKYGPLPRKELRPRRRFDQFEMYLKVWDLKQQGLSLSKIAKQLYPGMHALDRVTDHYRRAKELIGGGYRELE